MYDSIDIIARHRGVIGIRKLLSSNLDYTRSILDLPIIPKLIDFLKEDAYPQIQFEAAWALTNIMSG